MFSFYVCLGKFDDSIEALVFLFFALYRELVRDPPIAVTGLSLVTSSSRCKRFCVKLLPRP